MEYAIHNQRDRRNLTDADIFRLVGLIDKRRKRGGDRRSEEVKSNRQPCLIETPSRDETAEAVGISPRKIGQTRTVFDHGAEETKEAVLSGEKTINRAYQETQDSKFIDWSATRSSNYTNWCYFRKQQTISTHYH